MKIYVLITLSIILLYLLRRLYIGLKCDRKLYIDVLTINILTILAIVFQCLTL
jgi:hypothetical protein